jgi:LEA14-like dessication related protein
MRIEYKHLVIFYSLVIAIALSGCSLKPVEIKEIGNVEVQGIQNNTLTVKISATIFNPNSRFTIKSTDMQFYMNNAELGKATLKDKLVIEGKASKSYSALVKVELTNLKGGIFSVLSMFQGKKRELKLTGNIRISGPLYWKTIQVKDYPIKL